MMRTKGLLGALAILTLATASVVAQEKQPKQQSPAQAQLPIPQTTVTVALDTPKQETPSSVPAGNAQLSAPQRYNYLIGPNAVTRKGLFTVHKVDDNYYFEIPFRMSDLVNSKIIHNLTSL